MCTGYLWLRPLARSVVGVCVLLACTANLTVAQEFTAPDEVIEVEPLYELQDQPVEERRWVEVELEEVYALSEGEGYFLYDAGRVRRDSAGHFYVLDREDRRIKVFNTNGHYLRSIGGGRGPGPAEFEGPLDFTVAPDGAIWVLDAGERDVTRFSTEGDVAETFRLDDTFPPQRITLTDEGNAIVLTLGSNFTMWSPQGESLRELGTIVKNQKEATWALGGSIRGGPGGFIFAPNRAGQLLRFDADDGVRYAVETLDEIPYPDVALFSTDDGRRRLRLVPQRRFSTWDLAVSTGKIYCYSLEASTDEKRVLDV